MEGPTRDAPGASGASPGDAFGQVAAEPKRDVARGDVLVAGLAHGAGAGTDVERDGDGGRAVARIAAADHRRGGGTQQRAAPHDELPSTRCCRLERVGDVRIIGDVNGGLRCSEAAGDVLASISWGDPALRPVPGREEVVGMVAALGCVVGEHEGVGRTRDEVGEPQPLNGRVPFVVGGVVLLDSAVGPAATQVAAGVPGAQVVGALVVRADRKVGERRRRDVRRIAGSRRGHLVERHEHRRQHERVGEGTLTVSVHRSLMRGCHRS